MIYLDYSATTKTSDEVLDTFCKVSRDFPGNPNSLHKLGIAARELESKSTEQICSLLGMEEAELIYTSGASESNNLAIKGIAESYENRGKHIITTRLEHSSIYGPLGYLMKKGFTVDFIETDANGMIDIESLQKAMKEETILVSISAVNSEIGLRQRVEEIGLFLKKYPKCFFHVDATQCIGKDHLEGAHIDLLSFTAHKFYGIKGIGALVKKKNIQLEPLIHGGKSTTKYRSGTPALPLMVSLAKALRLALLDLDTKYAYVQKLNDILQEKLTTYPKVAINHNRYCLPHMLNISVIGMKPETFQHALEEHDIYISTQSACASGDATSAAVLAFTDDPIKAASSLRISISYLTTEAEIQKYLEAFDVCYKKINLK